MTLDHGKFRCNHVLNGVHYVHREQRVGRRTETVRESYKYITSAHAGALVLTSAHHLEERTFPFLSF